MNFLEVLQDKEFLIEHNKNIIMSQKIVDYLIFKGNPKRYPREDVRDIKDQQGLHEIRGRLLHRCSVLELIFKEYTKSKETMFGPLKKEFLDKIMEEAEQGKRKLNATLSSKHSVKFSELKKALKKVADFRNDWAHGVVYYKLRKNPKQANNYIKNKKKIRSKSIKPPYFEDISKQFSIVFRYIKFQNLFEFKDFIIYPCYIR